MSITKNPDELNQFLPFFHSFGLTDVDAKVYLALLGSGKEMMGIKIATKAGVLRQYAYASLKKLSAIGLVLTHNKQKRALFTALPPSEFVPIEKERFEQVSLTAKSMESLMKPSGSQDFEILVGPRQIQDYEMEEMRAMKSPETLYIIGGRTADFIKVMGDNAFQYMNHQNRKNMTVYYLGNPKENETYQKMQKKGTYFLRYLNKLPETFTNIVIRKNAVAFYSFLTPPVVYVLKSEVIANDYKQFFNMLWEMAGE